MGAEHGATNGRAAVSRLFRHGIMPDGLPQSRTISGMLNGDGATQVEQTTLSTAIVDSPPRPDPLGIVNLRMYSPKEKAQITTLLAHYVGMTNLNILAELTSNGKLSKHEAERKDKYLDRHPDVSAEDYDQQRAAHLEGIRERTKRRINLRVYQTIQQSFGLESLTQAADLFDRQRQNANKAVIDHAELVYPDDGGTGLRNEVTLLKRPADLLEKALEVGTDHELRFELRRQFINTVIALHEARGRSRIADEKLAQIQNLLNDRFYAGKTGKNKPKEIYGLFDNETNELVGQPLFDTPTDPAPDGTHYKTLRLSVRPTKSGKNVLTKVDQKEEAAAIRKTVRKAQERKLKGQGDTISVEGDSRDTYRMKIVVIGDQATSDAVAIEMFEILTDRTCDSYFYDRDIMGNLILDDAGRPTGIPTGGGELKFGNRGGTGQSDKVNYTKIELEFQNAQQPLKIVIQPLESYIAEQLEVGNYDNDVGAFTGPAWSLYAERREQIISNSGIFFPRQIYPDLPNLNQRDTRTPTRRSVATASRLRTMKVLEEV